MPDSVAADRDQLARLQWRCRRGLLELDIVLLRFLERRAASFSEAELQMLDELLAFDDIELWKIVSGRCDRYEPRHRAMVLELRTS